MTLRLLPNALTILRMLLVGPLIWTLAAERHRAALALLVLAAVTDGLDGFLARRYGWGSRLGSVLDPLADKLLLSVVYLALAWLGHLPVWLAGLVVGRDLLIVTGAIAFHLLIEEVRMAPSPAGKANTAVQLTLIGVVVGSLAGFPFPSGLQEGLVWVTAVFAVWSGADYVYAWGRKAMLSRGRA